MTRSDMPGWFLGREFGGTVMMTCLFLPSAAWSAEAARDIIALLDQGKLRIELTADSAYELKMKLHNQTEDPLVAEIGPGLVADGFAQNQVLAQVRGGGSGAAQGLGLLETLEVPLAARGEALATIRTCCLNFGVPEPRKGSPLFLKPVAQYTSNTKVQALLRNLARQKVETQVAQVALWHLTDNIGWDKLAGSNPTQGIIPPAKMGLARQFVAQLDQPPADVAGSGAPLAELPEDPSFRISINPDPRGFNDQGVLARGIARQLRDLLPPAAVDHANSSDLTPSTSQPTTHWSVLVRSPDSRAENRRPYTIALQRARWDVARQRWQRDAIVDRRLSDVGSASAGESEQTLAKAILSAIAEHSIEAKWVRGKESAIQIAHQLPFALDGITVREARGGGRTFQIDQVIPPNGEVVVANPSSERSRSRLLASTFDVASSK